MLYASWGIIKVAIGFLLERVPAGVDLDFIGEELGRIPGVEDVHHIQAWGLTSGTNIFSTHVRASEAADTQTVLEDVHAAIEKTGSFYFATVQVETECVDTQGADDIDITAGKTPDGPLDAHASMTDPGSMADDGSHSTHDH